MIFKEIVDEVDVGGLLGGGGVVIEEGRDADVDVVDAFDLVGEFEGRPIIGLVRVGSRIKRHLTTLEWFKLIDCQVCRVDVSQPEQLGLCLA